MGRGGIGCGDIPGYQVFPMPDVDMQISLRVLHFGSQTGTYGAVCD